ncbi:hypothetical protein [Desulfoferula mesophila]|uniref:Uncharacterized protein n=1 Tax=Desulfoferula mesophila TaxID=3058419 RepID=A0AAU9EGQ0_9BACT|nr:hypothetical protein FAK_14800 [Desulfoferula mesophilus]
MIRQITVTKCRNCGGHFPIYPVPYPGVDGLCICCGYSFPNQIEDPEPVIDAMLTLRELDEDNIDEDITKQKNIEVYLANFKAMAAHVEFVEAFIKHGRMHRSYRLKDMEVRLKSALQCIEVLVQLAEENNFKIDVETGKDMNK